MMLERNPTQSITGILLLLGLMFFIAAVMFVRKFTTPKPARQEVCLQAAPLLEDLLPAAKAAPLVQL